LFLAVLAAGLTSSLAAGWRRGSSAIAVSLLLMYSGLFGHGVAGTAFFSGAFGALIAGALIEPAAPATPKRARSAGWRGPRGRAGGGAERGGGGGVGRAPARGPGAAPPARRSQRSRARSRPARRWPA